jgi:hypothetical protein
MANLTSCTDCENKISKSASMCPHCGAPTKKSYKERIGSYYKIAETILLVLFIYLSYQGYLIATECKLVGLNWHELELEEFGKLKLLGLKFVVATMSLLFLPWTSIVEMGDLDSAGKCVKHLVEEKNYMMFWYAGLLSIVVLKIFNGARNNLRRESDVGH